MNNSSLNLPVMKSLLAATLLLGFAVAPAPSATGADLSALVAAAAQWESGQNADPLRQLEQRIRDSAASRKARLDLEAGFVTLLAPETSFEAKRFACQQLAVIGSDASVPALARLLENNDTPGLACLAFGNRPSAKADAALCAALPAAQGQARLQIISTLGHRRVADAVKPLASLARAADTGLAQTAIQALGKIANAPAQRVLTALDGKLQPELQLVLAEALLRCADERVRGRARKDALAIYEQLAADTQPEFVRRGAFAGLLQCDRDGGERRILHTLRGNDPVLKPVAIRAVRDVPSRGASEKFGRELAGLAAGEQVWLIESLAARNDAAARSAITGMLVASAATTVRQASAQALGQIGEAIAAAPMVRALGAATDEAEVNTLVGALATLPGGRATDQAILTELSGAQGKVRAQLISSLANRRSPEVLQALLNETDAADPAVAKAAYRALARAVSAETLPALLDRFAGIRSADRREDAEAFLEQAVLNVEHPADRSTAVCAALSRAAAPEARLALLRLLPACGDRAALQALTAAQADADARVRETAVTALAEWPDDLAWDALAAIYRAPANEPQRHAALRALVRLMSEGRILADRQVGRYEALLAGARGDADLKLILSAMGGATHADTLRLALPLLDQSAVRAEAEIAVKKIAETIKEKEPALAKEALKRLGK